MMPRGLEPLSLHGIDSFIEHGGFVVIPPRTVSHVGLYFKGGRVYRDDEDVGGYLHESGIYGLILRHDRIEDPHKIESIRWRLLERRIARWATLTDAKKRFRALEPDFGNINPGTLKSYLNPSENQHPLEQLGAGPTSDEAAEAAREIIGIYRDCRAQQRRIVNVNSLLHDALGTAYKAHYKDDPRKAVRRGWSGGVVVKINGRIYTSEMDTWPTPDREVLDLG